MDEEAATKEIGMINELMDFRTLVVAILVVWSTGMLLGPFFAFAFLEKGAMSETAANVVRLVSSYLPIVGIFYLIVFADLLLERWPAVVGTLIVLLGGSVLTAASRWLK
jgi:hypothetical protein